MMTNKKSNVLLLTVSASFLSIGTGNVPAQEENYTENFRMEERTFATTGWNPFFILHPGYTLTLESEEDGEQLQVKITVLDETEMVAGIETRVVEEYETVDGEPAERSRNFFAYCIETSDIFYFGEDVDIYDKEGNVVSHDGAWRAGVDGAQPGIIMPGTILLGSRYYQEIAPGVALDRAEHLSLTETISTPYGEFNNCLKVIETTPLEPDEESIKLYAPGIGLVQDDDELLVEFSGAPDGPVIAPFEQISEFTENFLLELCEFGTAGRNPYFILEPGYHLVLEGEEDGDEVEVIITVLSETEVIDGITTRVVEERETVNGTIAEISRNFFAICQKTNSVFYFGEDVTNYDEEGNVEDHEGQWRVGVDGARPGLLIAGTPLLGSRYYQEIAPEIALDRGEDISLTDTIDTPAGSFDNCLVVQETTPLEPDSESTKIYAPGIGLVSDDELVLTEYGFTNAVEHWELME